MKDAFSVLFHEGTKNVTDYSKTPIPADDSLWPEEWKTIQYKEYERVPKIPLGKGKPTRDYFELVRSRRSRRDFSGKPIDLGVLSDLLAYSCGITAANGFRAYPSGGGRFPIEVYPIVIRGSEELPSGLYHYDVRTHGLDMLFQRNFSRDDVAKLFLYPFVRDASMVLLMTGVFWRTQHKYKERGYRYVLLEAGHVAQNMSLSAEALGLSNCATVGMDDRAIENLLEIDGFTESALHAIVLG